MKQKIPEHIPAGIFNGITGEIYEGISGRFLKWPLEKKKESSKEFLKEMPVEIF